MDNISERSLRSSSVDKDQKTPYTSDIRLDDTEKASKQAPTSLSDPKSYPEGGPEAWLTVAGCSACLFVSFGWVNCIGVFQNYYTTDILRGTSPSKVAWISSLQSAL